MKTELKTADMKNKFIYFENHGNEEGTGNFTIIYGDPEGDLGEGTITGVVDTEEEAIESCKRLNEIFESHTNERLDHLRRQLEDEERECITPTYCNGIRKAISLIDQLKAGNV